MRMKRGIGSDTLSEVGALCGGEGRILQWWRKVGCDEERREIGEFGGLVPKHRASKAALMKMVRLSFSSGLKARVLEASHNTINRINCSIPRRALDHRVL